MAERRHGGVSVFVWLSVALPVAAIAVSIGVIVALLHIERRRGQR